MQLYLSLPSVNKMYQKYKITYQIQNTTRHSRQILVSSSHTMKSRNGTKFSLFKSTKIQVQTIDIAHILFTIHEF